MKLWELETERLQLRQWKDSDFPVFSELNADPLVMEYFPKQLQPAESDAMAEQCRQLCDQQPHEL